MITREFKLYLTAGYELPVVINVNQYDRNEQWIFTLYESKDVRYIPSSGSVIGIKADGKIISNTGVVNANGQVVITETVQMTAVPGKSKYELLIDDSTHGTANFYILVEESPADKGIISESDLSLIREALDNVSETIIQEKVQEWMDENLNGDSTVVDKTLSLDGAAADSLAVGNALSDKVSNGYVEEGVAYFTNGEDVLFSITGIGGGGGSSGGGGSGNNAVLSATNTSGWLSKTVVPGEKCGISFSWSSLEDEMSTGAGTMTLKVNNVMKLNKSIEQGSVSIDITDYLNTGSNAIRVQITDVYNNSKTINFSVTVILLTITSSFDSSVIYTSAFDFPFIPTGAAEKTVYFKVDGLVIGTQIVTTSGRQAMFTIPAQTHGAHTLECYFEAEINGETVQSNHLRYSFMFVVSGDDTIIIASAFNQDEAARYSSISIPYYVYNPASLTTPVTLSVNGVTISELTASRALQTWSYRADTVGEKILTITAGADETPVTKTFVIDITPSEIDIEAETSSLALYLTSSGRSNSENDPSVWEYEDISASLINFNFASDGWQHDESGNVVLRVSGDARVLIPYKLFGTDFRSIGKTIEFEFATRDVRDYDTVIIQCVQGGRGLMITPMSVSLNSELTGISTQYKDNEHVRISFVIEKRTANRLLYCYINGVISGVVQYSDQDDFAQLVPVDISIGSNNATVDIYNIRIYDNDLTRYQMLTNWIADTQDVDLMLERYKRNDLYDEYGQIVISKLPNYLPYLILEGAVLPQYKGDKKTISGTYVDPSDPTKSFTFTGAQIDVQGTSSQYYARKNYKVKFKNGFIMTSTGETVRKYALRGSDSSIPTNTFTFKADVASSEGANNVELARLYNDTCPYHTPGQLEDDRVRQGIDGFPIVVFWNNGISTSFLGKYNFNNDKGTEEVFGFVEGDESWEIRNNTSNRVIWESTDYSGDGWLNDFEARYPDTDPPYTDNTQLAAMASWINSTKNNPTKFKNELASHMEVQSVLFYYLFTELFLMVDSRAKNAFPSFMGGEM